MAKEFNRADRIGDAIQRFLAQIIPQELRDPRIGLVNINDVRVSRDLAYAKVYVTFVGSDESTSLEGVEALNKAAGYLRSFLAKELTSRSVPRLQFIYDKTAIEGQELSSLIDRAVAKDRDRQGARDEQGED